MCHWVLVIKLVLGLLFVRDDKIVQHTACHHHCLYTVMPQTNGPVQNSEPVGCKKNFISGKGHDFFIKFWNMK